MGTDPDFHKRISLSDEAHFGWGAVFAVTMVHKPLLTLPYIPIQTQFGVGILVNISSKIKLAVMLQPMGTATKRAWIPML